MKVKLPLELTLADADGIVIDSWNTEDDMDVIIVFADIPGVEEKVTDAIGEAADDELAVAEKVPEKDDDPDPLDSPIRGIGNNDERISMDGWSHQAHERNVDGDNFGKEDN